MRSAKLADDPSNLILLCRNCHRKVDDSPDEYPVSLIQKWKFRHENQVLKAASLTRGMELLPVIIRSAHIGSAPNPIHPDEAIEALVANGYSCAIDPVEILLDNTVTPSNDPMYWNLQVTNIRNQLQMLRNLQRRQHSSTPLAVFPRAEMPMLMAIGHALGNKGQHEVFQFNRHKKNWLFEDSLERPDFQVSFPSEVKSDSDIALTLELTAPIDESRVGAVIGEDIPIVRFSVDKPSPNIVSHPEVIEEFGLRIQDCLSQIESSIKRSSTIHLFPAMPASLAFVFGTLIQPKASNNFSIFDARGDDAQFHPAITLPRTELV